MNVLPRFLAVVCLFLLSSCGNIRLTEPLAASTSPEIQETLTGNWVVDGDVIQIAFDEQGKGKVAFIDRTDQVLQLGKGELAAVTRKDRHFLSLRNEDEEDPMDYHLFAEYTISDDQYLIIWPPEKEVFEKAISENALKGTITKSEHSGTLYISSPAVKVLDFLEEHPDAFDTREPIVYRKLK